MLECHVHDEDHCIRTRSFSDAHVSGSRGSGFVGQLYVEASYVPCSVLVVIVRDAVDHISKSLVFHTKNDKASVKAEYYLGRHFLSSGHHASILDFSGWQGH